jgi:hypothetical protein
VPPKVVPSIAVAAPQLLHRSHALYLKPVGAEPVQKTSWKQEMHRESVCRWVEVAECACHQA